MRPSFVWLSPTLTAIGRRLHIDAHYFAKNSVIVSLSHAVSILHGIVTGYLVTRLFAPELYGQYQFALTVVSIVMAFNIGSLPSAIARSVVKEGQAAPLRFTTLSFAAICTTGSLALLAAAFFSAWRGKPEVWPLLLAAALIYVPQMTGQHVFTGITIGQSQFSTAFRRSVLTKILTALSVLVVLTVFPSPLWLLIVMTGIPAAVYAISAVRELRQFPSTEKSWRVIRYGAHVSLATAPVALAWYVDKLMLSAFFGLETLAQFSVAILIPEQLKTWFKELFPVVFSKQAAAKDSTEHRRKLIRFILSGTALLILPLGLYIVAAPWLMPLLFPLYAAETLVPVTQIAAASLITIPSALLQQYLEAQGMLRGLRITYWTSSIVLVGSLLLLVPAYGAIGAILARTLFRLTSSICGFFIILLSPVERS